ncbi:mannose-6-phosphate isomerase, type 2 [Belliella buryatensis]|uniref:Mannose-6-phosphate isomerase, type 2 n=1 Tax=Belliella buryatensis TaxID=1500549 RepID=A0A239CPH1_9BACT|nr:phosphoheptose isomerase [Belliella buryatensis]SNS21394.1 mannose-6-phosphate isomerase, type 2 [Belliella buryatensis]
MFNTLKQDSTKSEIFSQIEFQLKEFHLEIIALDQNRPWGGFFVIEPNQIESFTSIFFEKEILDLSGSSSFSPKILLVAPFQKLSWQYHYRRYELWNLIAGNASYCRSYTDEENEPINMIQGEVIKLAQRERHRLIGLDNWGIIAEIWVHIDPKKPSDEEDIVRLKDEYSRKSPEKKLIS